MIKRGTMPKHCSIESRAPASLLLVPDLFVKPPTLDASEQLATFMG